jgi:hypothetical protein
MARFQAQTDKSMEKDLEEIRKKIGLKKNQKALLLRKLAESAQLLFRMTDNGLSVCLVKKGSREKPITLELPILEPFLRSLEDASHTQKPESIKLSNQEVQSLSEILNGEFNPSPALRKALERLASTKRRSPDLTWRNLDDK